MTINQTSTPQVVIKVAYKLPVKLHNISLPTQTCLTETSSFSLASHPASWFLVLQDGSSKQCDIIVVADGANSKIRASALPQEQPQSCGYVSIKVNHCWLHLICSAAMLSATSLRGSMLCADRY